MFSNAMTEADYNIEQYKWNEDRKKQNFEELKGLAKDYLEWYESLVEDGLSHNQATESAVYNVTKAYKNYLARGEKSMLGKLVYIRVYKPLIKYCKGTFYIRKALDELANFDDNFRIAKYLCSGRTKPAIHIVLKSIRERLIELNEMAMVNELDNALKDKKVRW